MTGIQQLQRYVRLLRKPLPVLTITKASGERWEIPAHPGLLAGALILTADPGVQGDSVWSLKYPDGQEVKVVATKPPFRSRAMPGYVVMVEYPKPGSALS